MAKKATIWLYVFLCLVIFMGGCGSNPQKPLGNQPDNQMNTPQQTNDAEKRIMANRFSTLAMETEGVQKATAVVTATSELAGSPVTTKPEPIGEKFVVMIGLTLNSNITQDKSKEMAIKEQVKAKIMADNQKVSEVLLTSDPDMIKKLQDIAAGVIQGKPMQSYAQNVDELNNSLRNQ
ncbi:MAG: hypothetical protein PHF24_00310 [Syntrophomonas sp.]|nr:hypothetical protein [Syntrophomonas sp.]